MISPVSPTTTPKIASMLCRQREGTLPTSISLIFTPPPTIAANNATTPITSRIAPVPFSMLAPQKAARPYRVRDRLARRLVFAQNSLYWARPSDERHNFTQAPARRAGLTRLSQGLGRQRADHDQAARRRLRHVA